MTLREGIEKARARGQEMGKGQGRITYDGGDIADIVADVLDHYVPLNTMPDQAQNERAFLSWKAKQDAIRNRLWDAYKEGVLSCK